MITLERQYQPSVTNIAIRFGYDEDIKRQIVTIGSRYTKTHRCWYIPYSTDHRRFKQLDIAAYTIQDNTSTNTRGTTDGPSSKSDHTAISSHREEHLLLPPHQGRHWDTNIRSNGSDLVEISCEVSWHEEVFDGSIPYQADDVTYLRRLKSSYW